MIYPEIWYQKKKAEDISTHVVEESFGVELHTQSQQQVHCGENAAWTKRTLSPKPPIVSYEPF